MPMSVDSRKNELYMSWSSDGETTTSETAAASTIVKKGSSSDNAGLADVTPVSPSEAPSSPAQVDFYTYSRDEEEAAAVTELPKGEERKKDPWKRVAIVLILAVLGVALYLWLGNKATSTKKPPRNPDDPTNESPVLSPSTPTTTATSPGTTIPSWAPTAPRIFDPPSAEDCIAIARGETLEGQADMMVETYEVVLDVAFDSGGLAISGILNRMESEIRQIVLPEILGCGDANRRLMEIEGLVDDNPSAPSSAIGSMFRGSSQRLLSSPSSLPPSSRYIMANAAVSVRNPSGEWCAAGSGPLCYRVIVSFDMAFRSDNLKVLSVIEFIAEAFKSTDSLLDKLLLGRPFQKIFVRDVYPAFHTAVPTASPSHF